MTKCVTFCLVVGVDNANNNKSKMATSMKSEKIDSLNFHQRRLLAMKLRAKNDKRVPVLLYLHPSVDSSGSLYGLQDLDGEILFQSSCADSGDCKSDQRSWMASFRGLLSAFNNHSENALVHEPPIGKFLVPMHFSVQQLSKIVATRAEKFANDTLRRVFDTDFGSQWVCMRNCLDAHYKTEQCQRTLVMHMARPGVAFESTRKHKAHLAPSTSIHFLDQFSGDDGLLRLYVSFEMRAVLDLHIETVCIEQVPQRQQCNIEQDENECLSARLPQRQSDLRLSAHRQNIEEPVDKESSLVGSLVRGTSFIGGTVCNTVSQVGQLPLASTQYLQKVSRQVYDSAKFNSSKSTNK